MKKFKLILLSTLLLSSHAFGAIQGQGPGYVLATRTTTGTGELYSYPKNTPDAKADCDLARRAGLKCEIVEIYFLKGKPVVINVRNNKNVSPNQENNNEYEEQIEAENGLE